MVDRSYVEPISDCLKQSREIYRAILLQRVAYLLHALATDR